MPAPAERHETRALLRAHLAAASGYRHLTRHCPICHRLLRLALEPLADPQPPDEATGPRDPAGAPHAPQEAAEGAARHPGEKQPPHEPPTSLRLAADGPERRESGDESPPAT
ncbi:DUF6274 family protein [Streptomyces sp. NPDC059166]|uniref:DUF6274 family protein n=1 Tax=Streptomyces sp. NPDC059166 TaxID=3346752 RepID=UPI0036BB0269